GQSHLGLRSAPARTARRARSRHSGAHHHRDARNGLGPVRPRQRNAPHSCFRPCRRRGMGPPDQDTLRGRVDGDLRIMSTIVLAWALTLAQVMLGLSMICATYRVALGPRAQDRVLGLDCLYVNAMLMLLVFGIQTGR